MSFILEFSIEANVGYAIRGQLSSGTPTLIKVDNHYQVEDLGDLRRVIDKTYGEFKIIDEKKYTDRKYDSMLSDCKNETISAAQTGVKRFTIAKADENVSIEIKYYEEAAK